MDRSVMRRATPLLLAAGLLIAANLPIGGALVGPGRPTSLASTTTTTQLFGRKVKRSTLSSLDDLDFSTTKQVKRSTRKAPKRNKSSSKDSGISPALAEWMQSQDGGDDGQSPVVDDASATSSTSEDASTFTSFAADQKKSQRRVKQSVRQAAEAARLEQIEAKVKELETAIEEGDKSLAATVLAWVQSLVTSEASGTSMKQLTAGKQRLDYRLAWVGSDDAISHLCTGLHKVPLARLQEVFLSLVGRNRLEIQEVLRILGPFPNVKNVLQGQSSTNNDKWTITWDSLIDGTGKEVLAGTAENVRVVDLQVLVSDPSVIVAVVPSSSGPRSDPLEHQGQHVLVFLREPQLDDKLELLRVA